MNIMKEVLEIVQYLKMQQQKTLKALVATLNLIDICVELFVDKYYARCVAYINDMKEMFKKIPQNMSKAITPKQKFQKRMVDIGGGWYMENFLREYLH